MRAKPRSGAWRQFVDAVRADHQMVARYAAKYRGAGRVSSSIALDIARKIGLQIMFVYRLMRWARAMRIPLGGEALSRVGRLLYGSDIHWDADFEPGVVIVHGMGLCISHGVKVASDTILFQHVTLGESVDPVTRVVGSPCIEADVHIGAGATLLGPIRVGAGSKIMAGCVVTCSVPPNSIVEAPAPVIRTRRAVAS